MSLPELHLDCSFSIRNILPTTFIFSQLALFVSLIFDKIHLPLKISPEPTDHVAAHNNEKNS